MAWPDGETVTGLATALYRMLREAADKKGRLPISDVLLSLPVEGRKICTELESDLRALEDRLRKNGVDMTKSLNSLETDHSFYEFAYWAVSNCEKKIYSLKTNLQFLLDDFIAIAKCADAREIPALAFKNVRPEIQEFDALMRSDKPIGEVLEVLIEKVGRLRDQFGDLRLA